jgi:hypothetical protein
LPVARFRGTNAIPAIFSAPDRTSCPPASEPLRLLTLLATSPHTALLKNGEGASPRVVLDLDFEDVTPVWSGFKATI